MIWGPRAGRVADTVEVAGRSAWVTHRHRGAVAGARVQALAIATALRHPPGEPVAAVRNASTDPLLGDRLDVAAELSARGDAREIAARIGSGLLAK